MRLPFSVCPGTPRRGVGGGNARLTHQNSSYRLFFSPYHCARSARTVYAFFYARSKKYIYSLERSLTNCSESKKFLCKDQKTLWTQPLTRKRCVISLKYLNVLITLLKLIAIVDANNWFYEWSECTAGLRDTSLICSPTALVRRFARILIAFFSLKINKKTIN